jgi:hypothetical protein
VHIALVATHSNYRYGRTHGIVILTGRRRDRVKTRTGKWRCEQNLHCAIEDLLELDQCAELNDAVNTFQACIVAMNDPMPNIFITRFML